MSLHISHHYNLLISYDLCRGPGHSSGHPCPCTQSHYYNLLISYDLCRGPGQSSVHPYSFTHGHYYTELISCGLYRGPVHSKGTLVPAHEVIITIASVVKTYQNWNAATLPSILLIVLPRIRLITSALLTYFVLSAHSTLWRVAFCASTSLYEAASSRMFLKS